MIFGEDFGQLASCGEYEVYKKGTTVAQLQAAVDGLSDEEYLDSFLTLSDDSVITTENSVLLPFMASTRLYLCNTCYPSGSIAIITYYASGFVEEITKTISSGELVRTSKRTSGTGASLLTLNSWTLYRRQKGYDVANGGSNVAYAIAPVQTSLSSADKNYAVGEQFLYDGHLYKVTSAITSGAQIVIGTNAVAAGSITEQMTKSLVLSSAGLTTSGCTIAKGGYAKLGNLVIVNLRITKTASGQCTISGFPAYASSGENYVTLAVTNVSGASPVPVGCAMRIQGEMTMTTDSSSGSFIISGCYICK